MPDSEARARPPVVHPPQRHESVTRLPRTVNVSSHSRSRNGPPFAGAFLPMFAVFIRHAAYEQPHDVPSAHLLHPLTKQGEAQARALAELVISLRDEQAARLCDVIDASPLLRGYQTAAILAEALESRTNDRFVVTESIALCERSVGAAANLTVTQVETILERDPRFGRPPSDWKSAPEHRLPVPGAESLRDAGARVAAHVRARMKLLAAEQGERFMKLFVGHGAAFRYAACELGALELREAPGLSMHHCGAVVLRHEENGLFRKVGGAWKVRDAAHAHD